MSRQDVSRMDAWAAWLARQPRMVRIIITAGVAVVGSVATSQVLTLLAGDAAFYDVQTVTTIYVVAAVIGVGLYVVGYWSLLGFEREAHPDMGKRAVYFVMLGIVLGIALVIWLLISLVIAILPPEIPL